MRRLVVSIWEKLENITSTERETIRRFCERKIDEINLEMKEPLADRLSLMQDKRDYLLVMAWITDPPTYRLQ